MRAKDPEAFARYNEQNKTEYKNNRYKASGGEYNCVRCGIKVDLDGSMSCRGENLICNSCAVHYENTVHGNIFYWLCERQTEAFD